MFEHILRNSDEMIEFIIFLIGLVALSIVVGICNFFSDTYAEMKQKEKYEFEQKKKQEALALEIQRKAAEQELELKKQAGLDPLYQQQYRTNKRYKIIIGCLLTTIVFFIGYFLLSKQYVTSKTAQYISSTLNEIHHVPQNEQVREQDQQHRSEPLLSTDDLKVEQQVFSKQESMDDTHAFNQTVVQKPLEVGQDSEEHSGFSTISTDEADEYIGEMMTVCGKISQISYTSKATYINFGDKYPKHTFSGVIWSNHKIPLMEGMPTCIHGLIQSYKGGAQIIIDSVEKQVSLY